MPYGDDKLPIPIFNVDGHERFGPYNRINQNGPEEMGWRVTRQNLNLNRDYAKVDSREARAIVEATTHYDDPKILAEISEGLGEAMPGIAIEEIPEAEMMQTRGK